MNLLADARGLFAREQRESLPVTFTDVIDYFNYAGSMYPYQTLTGNSWSIGSGFEGMAQVYRQQGVVFACILARLMLFAEARMAWRQVRSSGPGKLFGTPALSILERPWPNGTTGDLLSRALIDVDLAGVFYPARINGNRLARLRPDWVELVIGTNGKAGDPYDPSAEVLGYIYWPGGKSEQRKPIGFEANRVAPWAPLPDPTNPFVGVPWTNAVRPQLKAHSLATQHKAKFFENGATPNVIVTLDPNVGETDFDRWVKKFREGHEGARNAYKTIFLGGGARGEVVGANLQQLDFKATQGADETIIAAAAGVPPIIAGFSEGLASATYSNYAQARRRFADMTIRPLWRSFCASMGKLVVVPDAAELWYDDRDIPALREDAKDRAEIMKEQMLTVEAGVRGGFKPTTVVDAVQSEDLSLLEHTGLYSVQLQPPTTQQPQTVTDPASAAGRALAALISPHLKGQTDGRERDAA